jgi:hypothetical protein
LYYRRYRRLLPAEIMKYSAKYSAKYIARYSDENGNAYPAEDPFFVGRQVGRQPLQCVHGNIFNICCVFCQIKGERRGKKMYQNNDQKRIFLSLLPDISSFFL